MNIVEHLLGNRGDRPLTQLRAIDQQWQSLKQGKFNPTQAMTQEAGKLGEKDCDVAITF